MIETLLQQRAELDAAIANERKALSAAAIANARDIIEKHGLRLQDIFPRSAGNRPAARKVAAKFRDPATGKTWTGRGKSPKWFDASRPQDFSL